MPPCLINKNNDLEWKGCKVPEEACDNKKRKRSEKLS